MGKGERGDLYSLLQRAESEYRNWKDNYSLAGGAAGKQREILLFESNSKIISEFQPSLIPGFLQTKSYAGELLRLPFGPLFFGATDEDIEAMVLARIERQKMLYDHEKRVRAIVLEPALTTRVCSIETIYEQLHRLIDLCTLRSLEFGIVPSQAQLPLIPLGSYTIYDDQTVVLETLSGEQQLSSAEEVTLYSESFNAISEVALWGQNAAHLIRSIAQTLKPTRTHLDE